MIRVNMELESAIHPSRSRRLVEIVICNDGTGTSAIGHYDFTIKGRAGQVLKKGRIENWRRNDKSACALLQHVINTAYPKGADI